MNLVGRRPDSIDAHFVLSYVLRYAGLLDEAAAECEVAFLLDPRTQTSGLRSCAFVFLLQGKYDRARDYIALDHGSDFAKALTIQILNREGRVADAIQLGSPNMPQWNSYDLLQGCMARQSERTILALATAVEPSTDPEANYFSAAHLAYCGQNDRAIDMLKRAIEGQYCSYPAMDQDPSFAKVRTRPDYAAVRSAAAACQQNFVNGRSGPTKR